jgi:carbamoyl-phosphate synthase large subunit
MNARVLVTAAGSIVAQGIIKSLKLANKYTIIAADMSPLAAGLYRCDSGMLVPQVSSPSYIESIIQICKDNEVQAVFCGSDDELLALAEAKEAIEKTGAKLLTGSPEALAVARDKWRTYEFCMANNLSCAPSALPEDRDGFAKEFGFPLVVKPREGYGSLHFYVAKNKQEMDKAVSAIEQAGWRPILQKYLAGDAEFTTGVTVDKNSRYAMSCISIRKIIKHGQTYKAFIDDFRNIRKSAEEVALKLGASGPINVQTKLEGDVPVVFEINPRFSATCPMRAAAGVNEPDVVFRNAVLGEEIKVDSYERLVCMRYWNEVYVPYALYEKTSSTGRVQKDGSFVPDYF